MYQNFHTNKIHAPGLLVILKQRSDYFIFSVKKKTISTAYHSVPITEEQHIV